MKEKNEEKNRESVKKRESKESLLETLNQLFNWSFQQTLSAFNTLAIFSDQQAWALFLSVGNCVSINFLIFIVDE